MEKLPFRSQLASLDSYRAGTRMLLKRFANSKSGKPPSEFTEFKLHPDIIKFLDQEKIKNAMGIQVKAQLSFNVSLLPFQSF
jgi:uncharacterized protein YigE (DUF2233 family)